MRYRTARAVVCPDKFRGTLTAGEAAAAMAQGLMRAGFTEVVQAPLADGGEGSLETIHDSLGGSIRSTRVTGPLGAEVLAEWLVVPDGTAVIEMARASGRALVEGRPDPLGASTRGTGELIAAARAAGIKKVIVCVGGSSSTDGGLGALEALGWSLRGIDVTVACDVTTTFVAAAREFAPQKGATPAQVQLLVGRLERLSADFVQRTGVDVSEVEGSGAAGGLAGGLCAIGARLEPGFDVIARIVGLDDALVGADLVMTGEGRVDASSFAGKVVGGVIDAAFDEGIPSCCVIAGQITEDARNHLATLPNVLGLALTDRVWTPSEAFVRVALLVEEAALEGGRNALGSKNS